MHESTTRAPRRSGAGTAGCLEIFSSHGLLTAREDEDPRERSSGLPCRSSWFRLFASASTLVDAFCAERELETPEQILEALPTLEGLYVRAFDILGLPIVRIPAYKEVSSHALDRGDRDLDPSWGIFQRCLAAVDGLHPGGVIVEDDPRATSIFISHGALDAHTALDHIEPVPLTVLLAIRAGLDPDSLAPELA